MTIKLYKSDVSPPARAVMMTCDILNIPFEPIEINLPMREHLTPEFIKINPLHTIPVLEDGDLTLHDSHAIIMYLIDKYGKDDTLYPKDLKKRALINQILFFDTGILFTRLKCLIVSIFHDGATSLTERQRRDIDEAYGFLEAFLSRCTYLAGETITLADISAIANVTTIVYALPLDAKKYPKTSSWIMKLEQKSYCKKYNAKGSAILGERLRQAFQ